MIGLENEVKDVWYLAVSLCITATFIFLMILYSQVGTRLAYANDYKVAVANRMDFESDMYKFVNSAEEAELKENYVSGADIVRLISKYNTQFRYELTTRAGSTEVIEYGNEMHKKYRDLYLTLMGYDPKDVTKINNDQYYTADMAIWTQDCLVNYVLEDNVYEPHACWVTIARGDTEEITTDIDEIADNRRIITFHFSIR